MNENGGIEDGNKSCNETMSSVNIDNINDSDFDAVEENANNNDNDLGNKSGIPEDNNYEEDLKKKLEEEEQLKKKEEEDLINDFNEKLKKIDLTDCKKALNVDNNLDEENAAILQGKKMNSKHK